ncbi:hypothetical protein L7F22_061100 [Adiantum nelumboides]|nr:hypothetical protein [Adiantum nelumboides]
MNAVAYTKRVSPVISNTFLSKNCCLDISVGDIIVETIGWGCRKLATIAGALEEEEVVVKEGKAGSGVDKGDDAVAASTTKVASASNNGDLVSADVDEALEANGAFEGAIVVCKNLHFDAMEVGGRAGLDGVATQGAQQLGGPVLALRDVEGKELRLAEGAGGASAVNGSNESADVRTWAKPHLDIVLQLIGRGTGLLLHDAPSGSRTSGEC